MLFWDKCGIVRSKGGDISLSDISKRLLELIESKNISYGELSKKTNIPKSALQRYATGETEKIPITRIEVIAKALNTTAQFIMGWNDEEPTDNEIYDIPGVMPLPNTYKRPRLGTIACGEPILAEENIEAYDDIPDNIKCDFTLICKGDSMINSRINDGDIVYIKQQSQVDNGEIAAVLIDNEATLKRVYIYEDKVVLQPENTKYPPFVYTKEEMNDIRILGKAVGFLSKI